MRVSSTAGCEVASRFWCGTAMPPGLLVRPDVARAQRDAEAASVSVGSTIASVPAESGEVDNKAHGPALPRRFHGTVSLDTTRVGRDAGRIADEVIAHLAGLVGANVHVTLEVKANVASGVPDHVVRTVTENASNPQVRGSLVGLKND